MQFNRPIIFYIAVIVMMVPMALEAQITDGVYFIGGPGYVQANTTTNYYLCPTEPNASWNYYYLDPDQYTNTNTGSYFMTTYTCRKPANNYDAAKAMWIIKKHATENYYYIIRAYDGKYLTLNGRMTNNSNVSANRMRLHVETNASPGDNALFKIEANNSHKNISAKNAPDEYIYLNVNKGNKEYLVGYGNAEGNVALGGIIGVWSGATENSLWDLEPTKINAPTITHTSTEGYTITPPFTLPNGYAIRYTTNPAVTPGAVTGTQYTIGNEITIVETCTLRAWVVAFGMVISEIAEYDVYGATPSPLFEVLCDNSLQLSCILNDAVIYYTVGDPNPSNTNGTLYESPITGLTDGGTVYAIAYSGGSPSSVSNVTYHSNTAEPTITLSSIVTSPSSPAITTVTITNDPNATGADIYYTLDGSDPDLDNVGAGPSGTMQYTAPFNWNAGDNLTLRAVAKLSDRGVSCPVTEMSRPKWPTINASSICYGTDRVNTFTLSGVETGKTYWYALSNNSGATAPNPDSYTYTQYTNGAMDVEGISNWNGSLEVTLHAYAQDAENNRSVIRSSNFSMTYTEAPTITHSSNSVTITAVAGATIKYTVDGGAEQTYSGSFTVTVGQSHTITATAQVSGEGKSCETMCVIILPQTIATLAELKNMSSDGAYILSEDIDNAGSYETLNSFAGSFDGAGHTISGLTKPLFGTANGAVIHDVNLKEAAITGTDTLGAIACVATGYTRVYNCGILPDEAAFSSTDHPSVSTTGNCAGSIVGSLRDHSRVVNCFSYADVSSGDLAAGIVGYNAYVSSTSNGISYGSTAKVTSGKYTQLRTMVVNCMFYGDITASKIYPVYGGARITNKGVNAINNYNYYSIGCAFAGTFQDYNCSWPAQLDHLTRYEFHRNLLNSNRELCGWWVGAPYAPATMTTANVQAVPKDASLIAKWVLDPSIAPYPILKPFGKYFSPVNIDANASWREAANNWEGKKQGTLSVTVNSGSQFTAADQTISLVITDMDTLRSDYCYRKVQLPYYNTVFGNPDSDTWAAKYAGNYTDYVVTGWEITSTDGASGTFTQHWQDGYNFTDRYCSDKDLYSVSGRIFAQGGYYYVPYDVTQITITAHWGKAYYLDNTDHSYDRVYLSQTNAGTHFAPAGYRPATLNNGQIIVHPDKINDVINMISTAGSVYDYALVLVGNHQYRTSNVDIKGSNGNKEFTIMSSDFDFDEEPDHCLEWQLGQKYTRQSFCPIRFDFLPVVELGLATKENGSTQYYSLGCYRPLGHFEVTETSLIHFVQFEFGNKSRTIDAPLILNGGIFDQYTKGTESASGANDHINYIIIGGNVLMPSFTPGAHVNKISNKPTRHCAVNVLGGKFNNLYLTGNYNDNVTPNQDNPHCYIDGSYINHVAAAGKEGINGDVTFKINHSVIHEFYGGSTMSRDNQLVTGNINVTVDSSFVSNYCGGPKFGDMNISGNKTVTTNATGTIFRKYYGGGNGGTSYVQYDSRDNTTTVQGYNWNGTGTNQGSLNAYHPNEYISIDTGYMADYNLEIVNVSTGTEAGEAVFRTYFLAAQFSATNTGSITNNLKHCKVLENFYGGGNLGGVEGNVTSVLDSTEVCGSAFGAGFSASIPKVKILQSNTKTPPSINVNTGIITEQEGGTYDTYTWTNDSNLSTTHPIGGNYFYTEVPLVNLGTVSGNVTLTLKGNTIIGTEGVNTTGFVYGGGDESAVTGNTSVKLQQGATVRGSVYGGGNSGPVGGDSEVIIQDETINP